MGSNTHTHTHTHTHTNIWEFLEFLGKEQSFTELVIEKSLMGEPKRKSTTKQMMKNECLKKMITEYSSRTRGGFLPFLTGIGHKIQYA